MKHSLLLATLLGVRLASLAAQTAQTQERGDRNLPPGETVVGKVTSVGKDSLVVAPLMGGDPVIVKVGENTRISKDRQPVKLDGAPWSSSWAEAASLAQLKPGLYTCQVNVIDDAGGTFSFPSLPILVREKPAVPAPPATTAGSSSGSRQ